jgi:hypothetical protein
MNAVQNFASHSFADYAQYHMVIDMDNAGLFCQVPSSDGKWYTVRCVEGKSSVHASHCNCPSFARHQHCTHIEVVKAYYGKIYKPAPVAVEAPVKEVAKIVKVRNPRNGLVRKVRNGGLVKVAQPAPVAKVVELPVQTAKITDISTRGNLSSNKGFSILR